jgi:hypothetical protein
MRRQIAMFLCCAVGAADLATGAMLAFVVLGGAKGSQMQ